MSLEYVAAYHVHCGITLRSGHRILLTALDQCTTYAGLIEGNPGKSMNDGIVEQAISEAQRHCVDGAKPYLLAPARRDFLREPGDMAIVPVVLEPIEWLPLVLCVGFFSGPSVRNPNAYKSVLTLVWFQDEYAMPIDARILERIAFLNWDAVAMDVEG